MRFLCAVGDVTKIGTWSGTPYFMLAAGKASGFLDGGMRLDVASAQGGRALWNIGQLLRTGNFGGFQYSGRFLERLFDTGASLPREAEIISFFPLLPPPGRHSGPFSLYIDATLKQNFEEYGIGKRVAAGFQADILAREKAQYQRAERIVTMCRWAARSVVEDYGIGADKIHVVTPGANLDTEAVQTAAMQGFDSDLKPLRLVFVGKDWRRKNLTFLFEIADEARQRGIAIEVVVVGPRECELPRHPALRSAGFIRKERDGDHFIATVTSAHFGCLFSHAEAAAMSKWEFLALGVPFLGWDVGGLDDGMDEGLGHIFPAGAHACDVVDYLQAFVASPDKYQALRQSAYGRRMAVTWPTALGRFDAIWDGDTQCQFQAAHGAVEERSGSCK